MKFNFPSCWEEISYKNENIIFSKTALCQLFKSTPARPF